MDTNIANTIPSAAKGLASASDNSANAFFKIKDVARMLRVDYQVVRGLIVDGKLRASKIGRCWRISQRDLDLYIEKRANTI